jgi:hypothetical protein
VLVRGEGNGASAAPQYDYDIFTIGAGSGGVRGSRFAASYGGWHNSPSCAAIFGRGSGRLLSPPPAQLAPACLAASLASLGAAVA